MHSALTMSLFISTGLGWHKGTIIEVIAAELTKHRRSQSRIIARSEIDYIGLGNYQLMYNSR